MSPSPPCAAISVRLAPVSFSWNFRRLTRKWKLSRTWWMTRCVMNATVWIQMGNRHLFSVATWIVLGISVSSVGPWCMRTRRNRPIDPWLKRVEIESRPVGHNPPNTFRDLSILLIEDSFYDHFFKIFIFLYYLCLLRFLFTQSCCVLYFLGLSFALPNHLS